MTNTKSGKKLALELLSQWKELQYTGNLSEEVYYRISKLDRRVHPVIDKMYLKTIKGQKTLQMCAENTHDLRRALQNEEGRFYHLLTQLEKTCEELLKKTYEFRIKAG